MSKTNALSQFGRMSYGVHLLLYPSLLGLYVFGLKPWNDRRNKAAADAEWESMPKAKKVDPDLFNPFTPIPYHNNPELKYAFAHINMHGFLNENQINVQNYVWKNYHNSYDHNSQGGYLYNWTSVHSAIDDNKNSHGHGHGHH